MRSNFNRTAFVAFIAFGHASLAVMEVTELIDATASDERVSELYAELQLLHARLRCHFACGHDETVSSLAQDVVELAGRTIDAIEQDSDRPGR